MNTTGNQRTTMNTTETTENYRTTMNTTERP